MKKLICLILTSMLMTVCLNAKSLVGQKFKWQYSDSVFTQPYIDIDEVRTGADGVQVRYMHGGFSDGTMFSYYFPVKKQLYKGHFFEYISPFPGSECLYASLSGGDDDMAEFSVSNGAYFIETNEGGAIDFTRPETNRESSISAYRANAACAEFSRVVAKQIYATKERPFGYIFGGSGGAYRTTGSMESTEGVWDGATPFVQGSPNAIPNVFSVRMNALRVLHDKFPLIVDALEVGGSGNPEQGMNAQERAVWEETCKMGFPKKAWYGFRYMDQHGYVATYSGVCQLLAQYFTDFWTKPGYEGYQPDSLLRANHIQQEAVITGFYDQKMCERLHLVPVINDADEGQADRASANVGAKDRKPRALLTNEVFPDVFFMIGDLFVKSGKAKGEVIQMHGVHDNIAVLSTVSRADVLNELEIGDTVMVDNSRGLASLFLHRHQIPTPDYYAWDQFRDANGQPIYPQNLPLAGPLFTQAASGCLPQGTFHGKLILVESLYDRECYPWQADWYKKAVIKNKGQEFCDNNFRLWFTDRCTHGGVDDSTQVISYNPIIQQALLDVANWVEKGIEPSHSTTYNIVDTQVEIPETATERGGVQPSVTLTINGQQRVDTHINQEVMIHAVANCPKGTGRIVRAELCVGEAANLYEPGPKGNAPVLECKPAHYVNIDLSNAKYNEDGTQVEFDVPVKYSDVGTYFPAIRVSSSRSGKPGRYGQIQNLNRVRVVVEL